jgi:hypothetical protein
MLAIFVSNLLVSYFYVSNLCSFIDFLTVYPKIQQFDFVLSAYTDFLATLRNLLNSNLTARVSV